MLPQHFLQPSSISNKKKTWNLNTYIILISIPNNNFHSIKTFTLGLLKFIQPFIKITGVHIQLYRYLSLGKWKLFIYYFFYFSLYAVFMFNLTFLVKLCRVNWNIKNKIKYQKIIKYICGGYIFFLFLVVHK